jgi:hypothetical protein
MALALVGSGLYSPAAPALIARPRRLIAPTRAPFHPSKSMFPFGTAIGAFIVKPGSASFGIGSGSIIIPNFNSITFNLIGTGGGGGAGAYNVGATGQDSTVYTATNLLAHGGRGGSPGDHVNGPWGAPGSESGPAGAQLIDGGGSGGGGGGYAYYDNWTYIAGNGGAGGHVIMTWNLGDPGAPQPGATITFYVGTGGSGGGYGGGNSNGGGAGGNGSLSVNWI